MATEKKEEKKVKRPTPIKRDLQNKKKRLENRSFKSKVRSAIRQFDDSLAKGDAEAIKTSLNAVYSLMDKGIKTNVFKKNTVSRTKSRLAARAAKTK